MYIVHIHMYSMYVHIHTEILLLYTVQLYQFSDVGATRKRRADLDIGLQALCL